MPHALFLNRVYPPVEGATGEHLSELAEHLVGEGWRVTVATGACAGEPRDGLRGGVRVLRAAGGPTLVRKQGGRAGTLGRVLDYVRQYPGLAAAARRAGPADIVVTKTDPPMLAVLGPLVRRGARLVHWSQDLYPDVAAALGVLPPRSPLTRGLRALAASAMRRGDAVVSIGACMTDRIRARGVAADRIAEIPNWALDGVASVPHADNAWRREHVEADASDGTEGGRFVVMYSGNMGLAHPFEAMLDAAAELAATDPDVLWLFVGSGARKAWIEAEAVRRALPNVRVLPFQPKERLSESLSAADLHVVSMEAHLSGLLVPSKIYGVAAAGRPCVFVGPAASEAARFVARHDGGTVLDAAADAPISGTALAAAVRAWKSDPSRLAAAGLRMARAATDGRTASLAAHAALLRRLVAA